MDMIARIFPVESQEALMAFAKAIDQWPSEAKTEFFDHFGAGRERWFFQEIDGRSYVISVAESEHPDVGYHHLAVSSDPFTAWFREQVMNLTKVDLGTRPKGPDARLVYEFRR